MHLRLVLLALILMIVGLLAFQLSLGLCVQEDAYISFRYARNLVDGHGLVYNAGERVEGYTNFLWTVIIAAGMKAGLDPVPFSRFLGMGCALALLLFTFFTARLRDREFGATGGLIAGVVIAASTAVAVESVQGLESVFFALLITVGVMLSITGHRRDINGEAGATKWLAGGSSVLLLAALTRPEGLGVFILLNMAITGIRMRYKLPLHSRNRLIALAVFLVPWLLYFGLRYNYYGYLLPNTFYAKTGGGLDHVWRGLEYVGNFLRQNPALILATVFFGALTFRGRTPARKSFPVTRPVLLTVIIGYLLYVITVGGDFKMTHRFIIPVLPLWALLLDDLISRRSRFISTARLRTLIPWAVAVLIVANVMLGIGDARLWAKRRSWDLQRRTAAGEYLRQNAPKDAVLAIHSAGIIPYISGLKTIDMWGLNDLHIGHKKMPDMGKTRRIGHEKNDTPYVFGQWPTYHIDENFYVQPQPQPDLVRRILGSPGAAQVAARYRVRSEPVRIDDGKGVRTYYFNFLELMR